MFESKIEGSVGSKAGRRSAERDSLFLLATIARPGQPESELKPLRVRNLSAIGLMADFLDVAEEGDKVIVTVRGVGAVAGKVAWVKRGRIGVTFDAEIDPKMARRPVAKPATPSWNNPA